MSVLIAKFLDFDIVLFLKKWRVSLTHLTHNFDEEAVMILYSPSIQTKQNNDLKLKIS